MEIERDRPDAVAAHLGSRTIGIPDVHARLRALIDQEVTKIKAREQAMDQLRARFGKDAIVKGLVFSPHRDKRDETSINRAAPLDEDEAED